MENTLMHYGILGMKWGVRRTPEQLGHVRPKKEKKPNYHVSARKVKKNEKYMTDQELQRSINRINMQNQVNNLSPSMVSKGKKAMGNYTKTIGGILAAVAITKKFSGEISAVLSALFNKVGIGPIDLTNWSRFY